ncbi:hypothetical protein HK405_010519, partial [Cladochytrium tenue]
MSSIGRDRVTTLLQRHNMVSVATAAQALAFERIIGSMVATQNSSSSITAIVLCSRCAGESNGSFTDHASSSSSQLPPLTPLAPAVAMTAIWRRTGEILAGSRGLADRLGLPWQLLNPNRSQPLRLSSSAATAAASSTVTSAFTSSGRDAPPTPPTSAAAVPTAKKLSGRGPNYGFAPPAREQSDLAAWDDDDESSEYNASVDNDDFDREDLDRTGRSAPTGRSSPLTVYECMTEDSAVAYWESFAAVAFTTGTSSGPPDAPGSARAGAVAAAALAAPPRDTAVLRDCVLRVPWWGWGPSAANGDNASAAAAAAVGASGVPCSRCGRSPATSIARASSPPLWLPAHPKAYSSLHGSSLQPRAGDGGGGGPVPARGAPIQCVLAFKVRRAPPIPGAPATDGPAPPL